MEIVNENRWVRRCGEREVFADTAEHVALVLRTLGIEETCWETFVDGFAREAVAENLSVAQRAAILQKLWQPLSPHHASLPETQALLCLICERDKVIAVAARRQENEAPLVYGVCESCGAGRLLAGGVADSIYQQPDYYHARDAGNAGYENYLAERDYREVKGRRLINWIQAQAQRPVKTLLEVGSGFGFTRAAAEQLSFRTRGVDLNPHAAQGAQAIYQHETFTGTLAQAIESNAITPFSHDVVLYQFVLEHLRDLPGELKLAARALSPCGVLALVVPNMQALEREVFGASYRSFRRDHLWLFSRVSIELLLARVGLKPIIIASECNVQLFRGFLTEAELRQLDADCRAADMLILAERTSA
jgi:predicted TPR repeat methyltransferase